MAKAVCFIFPFALFGQIFHQSFEGALSTFICHCECRKALQAQVKDHLHKPDWPTDLLKLANHCIFSMVLKD